MIILKGREIRRNEILDAARDLFLHDGYAATPITDILDRSLISRGTLYYYFKSKEELLDALVERYCERLLGAWKSVIFDTNIAPAGKLNRLMAMANPLLPEFGGQSPGFRSLFTDNNLLFRTRLDRMIRRIAAEEWREVFSQGVQEGIVSSDSPATVRFAVMMVQSVIEEIALTACCGMAGSIERAEAAAGLFRKNMELFLGAPSGTVTFPGRELLAAAGGPS